MKTKQKKKRKVKKDTKISRQDRVNISKSKETWERGSSFFESDFSFFFFPNEHIDTEMS